MAALELDDEAEEDVVVLMVTYFDEAYAVLPLNLNWYHQTPDLSLAFPVIVKVKGRNVAIELVGNPIYQGANDTYYNVDKNGTKHPPQPQIWSCKDIYLTLTLGDIKCHMNGEPSYSQIDINNRPLEFWTPWKPMEYWIN